MCSELRVAGRNCDEDNAALTVIGTSVGNYQIESLIGEGGMGRVYQALHPGIGRKAAVKVLAAGAAADPHVVGRFVTEARAAAAIRHPNIIDIYDSGVLRNGAPYIVMEYLEGESLARVLRRGPVPLDDALDWACQVAEALAAAHKHSVVHRDLKPDNLFLVPDPRRLGKKQVKVLDFGIAKLQHPTLGQVHSTRTGSLLGTPLYMSPEQCMGMKDIDDRTDIYSLGVILYELCTGRRPFDGDGVYAVITMHVSEPPVPPSTYRPGLPAELEAIILRALAKAPAERQESMAVLLSRLELVRGNTRASTEALLRASPRTREAVFRASSGAVPEIETIGDAAVSKQATAPTARAAGPARRFLPIALAAGVALFALYRWGPLAHQELPPGRAGPAVPLPATPAPATGPLYPESVEIGLESAPSGAAVFVNDVMVGTTPGRYLAARPGEPVAFVFHLQGFAPERIRALPTAGLTVSARFSTPLTRQRPVSTKRKPERAPAHAATDIQTER